MRRVFIVGILFLLMFALDYLQVSQDHAFNPKSLAALGFVLMAAYSLGEIVGRFGLPKITGHIFTGMLFGPYAINLFSIGVVDDIKLINALAIGLIALTAGGEMKFAGLKKVAKTLSLIVLIKGTIILVAVVAAVFFARPLIPALDSGSTAWIVSVGMIFGVLAMGTSPAATIAVINETGSRGRLSDIVLGAAVAKDVVMVVLLAVAISLTQLFSSVGSVFDPQVLLTVGRELLLSILAGTFLGALLIAYIRFVHAEMWLLIIGVVFFATAMAEQFHLEALLMFITAGFTVQNFSKHGDEFIHPIERVSLPVYVVFFSIAGAGLNLLALRQVWPIALILVLVRIAAIYAGTGWAARLSGEPPEIRKNAWLSFVSQAGVVLGLSIIVVNNLPGIGAEIQVIVIATIAINLILGPVMFKMALTRVGETLGMRQKAEARDRESEPEVSHVADTGPPPLQASDFPVPQFDSPELNETASAFRKDLVFLQKQFEAVLIDTPADQLAHFTSQMQRRCQEVLGRLDDAPETGEPETANRFLHKVRDSRAGFSKSLSEKINVLAADTRRVELSKEAFREWFAAVDESCSRVPLRVVVAQEPERFSRADRDTVYVRIGKTLKRALRRSRRLFGAGSPWTRAIPFRKLAKYHFGGMLPARMVPVANQIAAQAFFTLRKMRLVYTRFDEIHDQIIAHLDRAKTTEAEPLPVDAVAILRREMDDNFAETLLDQTRYRDHLKRHLLSSLGLAYAAFLDDLQLAGTFQLPGRRFNFSRVYEKTKKAKGEIARALDIWKKYERGLAATQTKHLEIVLLVDEASTVVDETVARVMEKIDERLVAALTSTKEQCTELLQRLGGEYEDIQSPQKLEALVGQYREGIVERIQSQTIAQLSRLRDNRELGSLIDVMLQRFAALSDQMPKEISVLEETELRVQAGDGITPPEVKPKSIPLRDISRSYLEVQLVRRLSDVNRTIYTQIDETLHTVDEVRRILHFNLQAAAQELAKLGLEAPSEDVSKRMARSLELFRGGIDRAVGRLDAAVVNIQSLKQSVYDDILSHVGEELRDLETLMLTKTAFEAQVRLHKTKAMDRGFRLARRVWEAFARVLAGWIRRYRPMGPEMVRDLKSTLGLQAYTREEVLAIYDQITLDETAFATLPFIYQKLFDLTPLESGDFLVAREEEMQAATAARERWERGHHASIAVIGEIGSGKTSFINAIAASVFEGLQVQKKSFVNTTIRDADMTQELCGLLGLSKDLDFEDIEAVLTASGERRVVILEDAHKLYLRTLGGFETLRRLLLLIGATSHRVLWILSMRHYAWGYLDRVLKISDYFSFVIHTENVTRDELEQVVLSRHRVSGFQLRFLPTPALEENKKYRKAVTEEARQSLVRKEFFTQLSKASEGNILTAMFYWLKSLGDASDNVLTIKPMKRLRLDFLQDMPVDKVMTLGMIAQHGSLTVQEHSKVLGTDDPSSQATLTYLVHINLLNRKISPGRADRFEINRLVYKSLSQELRARNILH